MITPTIDLHAVAAARRRAEERPSRLAAWLGLACFILAIAAGETAHRGSLRAAVGIIILAAVLWVAHVIAGVRRTRR